MAIAKIPTVSNFLCYFDLSTGGLILGWFDAVIYGIVLFILILNMFMGMEIMSREQLDNFSVLGKKIKYFLIKLSGVSKSNIFYFRTCYRFCSSIGHTGILLRNIGSFYKRH